MGWDDRPYFRDRSSSTNPLMWIINGSIPLFTFRGIRVRAHVSLLLFIVLTILLDWRDNYPIQLRAFSMGLLTLMVILHEFGHCFMARALGGSADEVLLWPLGGLATVDPPNRPRAHFLTSAAGPAVNLILCIVCGVGIYLTTPTEWMKLADQHAHFILSPPNPFDMSIPFRAGWHDAAFYFWWVFTINYLLLLFNLLPIYPLDGGQMLQSVLWPVLGHFRSMMLATAFGMGGSVLLAIAGLATGSLLLVAIALWTFIRSYQERMLLRETGPEEWQDGVDYHASIYGLYESHTPRRRLDRRAIKRARRIAQKEKALRDRIDFILAKVSAGGGLRALTWRERRALRKATERQKRSEAELSQFRD